MAEIRLQEGEPLENALRRFKRKVQQEDIIKEVTSLLLLKAGQKAPSEAGFRAEAHGKSFEQKVHLRRTRSGIRE